MKYKERELIRDTLAASTNIREDIEQVNARIENIKKQIEPIQNEYDQAKDGDDYRLLSKLKTELDVLKNKLNDGEMQIQILADAKERFVQEQKLEADLILLKENQEKDMTELHEKHMNELVELESIMNEE
jgi:predicted  nucleic acid-binding Zn-ribbon protein